MSAPQTESVAGHVLPTLPPEQHRDEIWLDLEGGIEDCTVRPDPRPRYMNERARLKTDKAIQEGGQRVTRSAYGDFLPAACRAVYVKRDTAETRVDFCLNLDGTGEAVLTTGIGFFDHMLTLLAKHGL